MRRDIEKDHCKAVTRLKIKRPSGSRSDHQWLFPTGSRPSLKEPLDMDRVTISLDSLKRDVFKQMTGVDVLDRVLAGIEAARKAGLDPIKINAVIVRGHNEDEVADFAAFAREHDVKMRFIEFMPLDSGHDWARNQVVSGREIRERIKRTVSAGSDSMSARLGNIFAVSLRRWRAGRNRHHRAGDRSILRRLLAHSSHR